MKRPAENKATYDASLQQLPWNSIRDVFAILKKKNLLGPLSVSALKIAYANLKRSYEAGGTSEFRSSWNKKEWFGFFRNSFDDQISDSARAAFERDEFDGAIEWDGDPQDQWVWDNAYEYFTDAYQTEVRESWDDFPETANYFHVFIAFMVRFLPLDGEILMTQYGSYMRITYFDKWVHSYDTYNGDPSDVGNLTDTISVEHWKDERWIQYWNEAPGSTLTVEFIYRALEDGWRFADRKTILENTPDTVQSQIDKPTMQSVTIYCANCKKKNVKFQCGHICGAAFYCNQKCADTHWEKHLCNE
jgi:hypothetical protein